MSTDEVGEGSVDKLINAIEIQSQEEQVITFGLAGRTEGGNVKVLMS